MMRFRRRRRILLGAAAVSCAALGAGFQAFAALIPVKQLTPSEQKIRVRVAEAVAAVTIRGYDLSLGELRADAETAWEIRCQSGRVRATRVEPAEGQKTIDLREPAVIRTPAGFIHFQDRQYREQLRIYSVGSFCEVVNEVPLEKYLEGVVNAEFNSKWNEEAIEAQVVAARTYALYQMKQARADAASPHFDVDATVKDQVYDGSLKEDFRASQAVHRTRGIVLTVGDSASPQPMKAFYHSTCGGMTELPQNVWGTAAAGFHHAVRCPYCASSPRFHWDADLKSGEIADAMIRGGRADGGYPGWPRDWADVVRGQLLSLRPRGYDASGRVTELITEWKTSRGARSLAISAARFREWIGPARFRSTAFQVSPSPSLVSGVFHFEGRGNGHGVGMCQWGAKVMGERGVKMAAILRHYYPDAILRKLW